VRNAAADAVAPFHLMTIVEVIEVDEGFVTTLAPDAPAFPTRQFALDVAARDGCVHPAIRKRPPKKRKARRLTVGPNRNCSWQNTNHPHQRREGRCLLH
jgi:hypothetical protein